MILVRSSDGREFGYGASVITGMNWRLLCGDSSAKKMIFITSEFLFWSGRQHFWSSTQVSRRCGGAVVNGGGTARTAIEDVGLVLTNGGGSGRGILGACRLCETLEFRTAAVATAYTPVRTFVGCARESTQCCIALTIGPCTAHGLIARPTPHVVGRRRDVPPVIGSKIQILVGSSGQAV